MKMTKYGATMTKEEKRIDTIKGIKKALSVGYYEKVMLLEKELMNEYGMTPAEIEMAIYK